MGLVYFSHIFYSVCLFCIFYVFSLVFFELSVPVQVISWKDSSPKVPIMCRVGRKTLSTQYVLRYYFDGYHTGIYVILCVQVPVVKSEIL